MISVDNLTHRYNGRTALSSVSLEVRQGEIYGLLGPNGSGKSTLFRILSTMMAPTAGRATVAGFDVAAAPDKVRRQVGVIFQSQSLDRKLSVAENLRAQGHLFGLTGAPLKARMAEILARLGLADRRNDLINSLSGGLRRRVEVAKALLHEPKVLLMDEPSTGLDPGARRELWQYIEELRTVKGVTVLLTSHILDEAERCDRLLLLHQGRAVAEGAPAALKARIGGDVVVLDIAEPGALREQIAARFGVDPKVSDGALRVEIANGHRFITEVVEAFPGLIRSVALHKPTLED
ncbi:MAG TPA: ABC transporter ATP-binding protein, partial [Bryobacteraceae bacterium]|nr:ABC transporter ATP-binding protein [Bryobacteraceae bacterium]